MSRREIEEEIAYAMLTGVVCFIGAVFTAGHVPGIVSAGLWAGVVWFPGRAWKLYGAVFAGHRKETGGERHA